LNANKTELILGLGNPGKQYEATRHNAGCWLVRTLADKLGVDLKENGKLQAYTGTAHFGARKLLLAIPTTYMNHSGFAAQKLLSFYKIEPEHLLVVHDELDLPVGTVRLKVGGGHGGQNGLRHIIDQLGQRKQFARLRIGIGHPGHKSKVTSHVLSAPNSEDKISIESAIDAAIAHIDGIAAGDFAKVMNTLHQFDGGPAK
jgi:PTH1 family peptidyl-tRNA hydrolase